MRHIADKRTGPRAGERELKLRWLPPIPVNYAAGSDLPAVIHIAKKGDGDAED